MPAPAFSNTGSSIPKRNRSPCCDSMERNTPSTGSSRRARPPDPISCRVSPWMWPPPSRNLERFTALLRSVANRFSAFLETNHEHHHQKRHEDRPNGEGRSQLAASPEPQRAKEKIADQQAHAVDEGQQR